MEVAWVDQAQVWVADTQAWVAVDARALGDILVVAAASHIAHLDTGVVALAGWIPLGRRTF